MDLAVSLCYIRRFQRHSPVAQLVEQLTVNQLVTGSSPVRGAIIFSIISDSYDFFGASFMACHDEISKTG